MYDNITVFTHSAIRIAGEKVLYFDPFQMTEEPCDADENDAADTEEAKADKTGEDEEDFGWDETDETEDRW